MLPNPNRYVQFALTLAQRVKKGLFLVTHKNEHRKSALQHGGASVSFWFGMKDNKK